MEDGGLRVEGGALKKEKKKENLKKKTCSLLFFSNYFQFLLVLLVLLVLLLQASGEYHELSKEYYFTQNSPKSPKFPFLFMISFTFLLR